MQCEIEERLKGLEEIVNSFGLSALEKCPRRARMTNSRQMRRESDGDIRCGSPQCFMHSSWGEFRVLQFETATYDRKVNGSDLK